jgi:hypothetical protein
LRKLWLFWSKHRTAEAEERGQFGNPEEGKYLPSEAVTRGLVKTWLTKKT